MVKQRKKPQKGLPMKRQIKPKDIKKLIVAGLVVTLGIGLYSIVASHTHQAKLERELNTKRQLIDNQVKELDKNKTLNIEQQKLIDELNRQKQELEKQLQAKRSAAVAYAEPVRRSFGGDCASWIAAAGITDIASAMELIRRESGCNPNAVNRSSGACGVAQELPCGKSGCSLGDGACQVRWMNGYVKARYGSWASAVAFHNSHNWY